MVHAQMHHPLFHSHNLTNTISAHTGILHRLGERDADGDEDAVYLSPLALGLAALLLIINGLLSAYLSLGLHKTLGIAALRQVTQHLHIQFCLYIVLVPYLTLSFTSAIHTYISANICTLVCTHVEMLSYEAC